MKLLNVVALGLGLKDVLHKTDPAIKYGAPEISEKWGKKKIKWPCDTALPDQVPVGRIHKYILASLSISSDSLKKKKKKKCVGQ